MTAQMRILCVDDDPDIRTIAVMALGLDSDMEVRSANGGAEVLALLDAGDWKPDVVLLDVMMPGMDGPAVLATLQGRSDCAGLPVIFMTARARKADVDAYRALGAIGVIVKPFDPLALAGEVRSLVRMP
ncbi:response regulator [Sphingomonas sp. CGMCC 1.13654]|uniref:Response regulator n=1 Tax=Sphingomonas chungangi TaxID=2683589 RepID=A0A838L6H3_9SPHN|nr:response regulator [Sphingomonas chungangi]MBA2934764.1 response regulator [Sphingomonas chungangi]MVW58075.1 response regulator [Sphingomonas chungangi]